MASLLFHHFFLLSILIIFSSSSLCQSQFPKSGYITLPTKLDPATHQYYTSSIGIGTPKHKMNLVIALEQDALWYDCNSHYNSSSYIPITCHDPTYCPPTASCFNCSLGPRKPGCTDNTCAYQVYNPFLTVFFPSADLGTDLLYLPRVNIPQRFLSACFESDGPFIVIPVLDGLVKGANGILGLGRNSKLPLPIQVSSLYNVIPKFAICLPSSEKSIGNVFIGGTPYALNSVPNRVAFAISTDPNSREYFVNVNSIKIDGELVNVSGKGFDGNIKISTLSNFTVLHSSIYKPFVRDFVTHAKAMKIKKVKAVKPFAACFDGKSIVKKNGVPDVPGVNLLLEENEGVSYEINGHNSMFEVKKDVMCLAFVDGGKQANTGIILGGYQMEDRILEFDLSTSILRFSDSLLHHSNASCSNPASLNF
ncbi:hypothetical protein PIB30_009937 [Stylosanthes scabra]|uniref:Peptidase A1 domain-containing protein n=1 Tax=Stylosanthes scabra TaxID=79078 RepID=A0ABU6T6R6_9FABA|nr:hypothetical protein [Stylosanthes scabra]